MNMEAPTYKRRSIFYPLRTILLLLLLVAVFIGLFGVPYLRIQHNRIFITYSNGLDGFECYGDFAPLITLVPVRERFPVWRDRFFEHFNHDHNGNQ